MLPAARRCFFLAAIVFGVFALPRAFGQSVPGWPLAGGDIGNRRWASSETLLNASNAGALVQKWTFTTQNDVSATPAVDRNANAVYFPDWSGAIYKVSATTGAVIWSRTMADYGLPPGVISRTTPALYGGLVIVGVGPPFTKTLPLGAWLLGLDAATGDREWIMQPDPSPYAVVTGSPAVHEGVVYLGVSSSEEGRIAPTFRGSVLAVSAANGAILWRTYMVPPSYSGGPVWSGAPAIDPGRNQVYVTTGNNYLVPKSVQNCETAANGDPVKILACQAPDNFEDSIVALDMTTGAIKWGHRCSAQDAWIAACLMPGNPFCPEPPGNDEDFGAGANLFTAVINGQPASLVGAGQKTGVYWALDAGAGTVVWETKIGPGGLLGGIEWGTAADGERIYVAISNSRRAPYYLQPSGIPWNGGSWAALDPATGNILWQVADPGIDTVIPGAPALSLAPVSVANGVVYCASMSGYMYALDARNGDTLWSFLAPGSVNAGPAIVDGSVYWGSGYHNFPARKPVGTASNTFYAFALPPELSVSSASMVFGSQEVGAGGDPRTVTVTNTGGMPLTIASIAVTGDFAGTDNCAGALPPAGSCIVTLTFTPAAAGVRSGAVTITANASNSPRTIELTGMGSPHAAPRIATPLTPGSVAPGSAEFTLVVNGTGFAPGAAVNWNGSARDTTRVSGSRLLAAIGGADVATSGTAAIHVINPAPGGGSSNVAYLPVTVATSAVFLRQSGIAAGGAPLSVAVGDFNRDGRLDLIAANSSDNTVSVLIGNADGTFQPHVDYATGQTPVHVAVGDWNADGKLDALVVNRADGTISLLLGNGDGTFQPRAEIAAGQSPESAAPGDFNQDGNLDVAIASSGSGVVSVLLGSGDGAFQPSIGYPAGQLPVSVTVADFNADGRLDLAAANQISGTISVLPGNGDGTFQPHVDYAAGEGTSAVAAADINGDGLQDLIAVSRDGNTVSVLPGNGDGTFGNRADYATGQSPQALALGDFNGDGILDVATAGAPAGVSLLLGNGDGTLRAHSDRSVAGGPSGLAAADFNSDGRIDLVTATAGSNSLSVLLQAPSATLSSDQIAFGNQTAGTASAPQMVTISNTGSAGLIIAGVGASGSFQTVGDCTGAVVPPGSSCSLAVTFTPAAVGDLTGTLTIDDNSGESPHVVNLSGTGAAPQFGLNLSLTQTIGGNVTAGRIILTNPAPAGGLVFALSSSNSGVASPPATVMVPGNAAVSPDFNVVTTGVSSATVVAISALCGGVTSAVNLTVYPAGVAKIVLSPSVIGGGATIAATIYLNGQAPAGGAVVSLSSSDTAVAPVPSSVMVTAGATSSPAFTITTSSVNSAAAVTISSLYRGATKTASLTVNPASLYALRLKVGVIGGGLPVIGNAVYLNGVAPAAGAVVTLSSSIPEAVTPASITVTPGSNTASFNISTASVTSPTVAAISATYAGVMKTANLTIQPATLYGVNLSPATVTGGVRTTSNRVTLNGLAPAGGALVSLLSSNPAVASVPASVSVPAGAAVSPWFAIQTALVDSPVSVTISASYGGLTKPATLNVTP